MSRRRGEFEHRTSIFEGAFRAWSHLGGILPQDLENLGATDLDPLTNPLDGTTDSRSRSKKSTVLNPDGSTRCEYPYEPLPRSGLAHPYVQAILSPWLGPDADNEAIQLGLTTLRTWWQHRRKGESGSAMAALGTEKMKGVVEGYTRHFFTLAHCLVMNDKEQPPRTLHSKMKELEKMRSKRNKKRFRDDEVGKVVASLGVRGFDSTAAAAAATDPFTDGDDDDMPTDSEFLEEHQQRQDPQAKGLGTAVTASFHSDLADTTLSPLERLHAAQRRQMTETQGVHGGQSSDMTAMPLVHIKNKCMPGKVDLPGVMEQVNHHSTQLAHRGGAGVVPMAVPSLDAMGQPIEMQPPQYGDPNTTPVVFVSSNGDIQIAMNVNGITCAHCVKIVETVLKGCNGNKSPIEGLLDAAADRVLCSVLLKIDKASSAKRVAFESTRNLAMVGYTAKTKEMTIVGAGADTKATLDLGALSTAFEVVANTDSEDVFDWSICCTCPDNGVLRDDCARHSQMNTRIFDAFHSREHQVTEYMAGCGMRYGMECTCGPNCRCKNCPIHSNGGSGQQQQMLMQHQPGLQEISELEPHMDDDDATIHVEQPMDFFGMGSHAAMPTIAGPIASVPEYMATDGGDIDFRIGEVAGGSRSGRNGSFTSEGRKERNGSILSAEGRKDRNDSLLSQGRKERNASILSYGNGLRGMSITSETTFGRAMSGLSALSIDWENLEDFDLEVDHSAHINNQGSSSRLSAEGGSGPRRSSIRRSFVASPEQQDSHNVSFKL